MKNYYDRQRTSTLAQIDHLYKEKDASFRGFRHSVGKEGQIGEQFKMKSKIITIQGNETMDGLVNWEASSAEDGDRFSKDAYDPNENKGKKSFDAYLKRKEIRAASRKASTEKVANLNKKTLEKELLTT